MKIENKQVKGDEKKVKQKYHFVEGDKKESIEATSLEEATKKFKEQKTNK